MSSRVYYGLWVVLLRLASGALAQLAPMTYEECEVLCALYSKEKYKGEDVKGSSIVAAPKEFAV
jgi:hypothetical protein